MIIFLEIRTNSKLKKSLILQITSQYQRRLKKRTQSPIFRIRIRVIKLIKRAEELGGLVPDVFDKNFVFICLEFSQERQLLKLVHIYNRLVVNLDEFFDVFQSFQIFLQEFEFIEFLNTIFLEKSPKILELVITSKIYFKSFFLKLLLSFAQFYKKNSAIDL